MFWISARPGYAGGMAYKSYARDRPQVPEEILRRLNAELFRWMVGEFFNTPKRGGLRVVSHLVREVPER